MAVRYIKPVPEETIDRLAKIFGPMSAAAQAKADAERRRANGEVVMFYKGIEEGRHYFFVGPVLC